ncbi:hypothetical protein LBMAG42_21870 [Deltaproteobacteria bacterium]|nr:hypothetical protein LBMAG42_21870 [Deltaproteobacteria bacterium]
MAVKAVFVDAGGTLLRPREPVGVTYARAARARGHERNPVRVEQRFRAAFAARRDQPQAGDGRAFWAPLVAEAVEVDDEALFEELYEWYSRPRAWWVDTEALRVLGDLSRSGVRLGILSNWDERLRVLYHRFALDRLFPLLVCSAEHGVEKPDPLLFQIACRVAGVAANEAVHIGDDQEKDVDAASRAGLIGLHFDDDRGWRGVELELKRLRRSAGLFAGG